MPGLKEREKFILGAVVKEYIDEAQPIGSKFLADNYGLGLSSATIRFSLQRLTEEGYLCQPHTSAGRIPTDKGYRFFIDELMKFAPLGFKEENLIKSFLGESDDDVELDALAFKKKLIKIMAEISKDLVMVSSLRENDIYYDGILNLFRKPEFQDVKQIKGIFKIMENFTNHLENLLGEITDRAKESRVFIGRENPFYEADDYSIIISSSKLLKRESDVFAILGPKRMDYNKNISLLNFVSDLEHAQ